MDGTYRKKWNFTLRREGDSTTVIYTDSVKKNSKHNRGKEKEKDERRGTSFRNLSEEKEMRFRMGSSSR